MADAAQVGLAVQGMLWPQPGLRGAAGSDSLCSKLDAAGVLCNAASPHSRRGGVPVGLASGAVAGAQLSCGAPALAPFMSEL